MKTLKTIYVGVAPFLVYFLYTFELSVLTVLSSIALGYLFVMCILPEEKKKLKKGKQQDNGKRKRD